MVRDVICHEDCDRLAAEYHKWLEKFRDRHPQNIKSIIHKYTVSHLAPTWEVRLKVKHVFAKLWETDKLLSSMDGIAIGAPPETSKSKFAEDVKSSLHLDQGQARMGLHAYQGAVYLEEAQASDWCFQVLERSHVHHEDFFKEYDPNPFSEFRKLSIEEVDWYKSRDCFNVRVPVSKGAVLLWDSRLVHDGAPPKHGRQNSKRWRYVTFVSMTPAIWAAEKDIQLKKKAYHSIQPTKHWSSDGVGLFREYKPNHGIDLVELPEIAEGKDVQKLAGVEPYDFEDGIPNGPKWKPKWKELDADLLH